MKHLITSITVLLISSRFLIFAGPQTVKVSANLEIVKLSQNAFVHISYADSQWGRIASNGLILIQNDKAFLFDTPMDEPTTIELVKYIKDSLGAFVTAFVPNHWHADCMGGLKYLHSLQVKSYANKMTIDLAQKNGYEIPQNEFTDSIYLKLENLDVCCFYLGAAHSMDNIVVWVPSEKILFGGCMVKEINAKNMGNYADGDLKSWPRTIEKVMARFPSAKIVIPGHGRFAGFELLKHTHELALAHAN